MPLRRREIELAVERELPGAPGEPPPRVRLTVRFELADGVAPTPEELRAALDELRATIGTLVGPGRPAAPARPDRELSELIETYRPRQVELVELLREEGEISPHEHALLREHLRELRRAAPAAPPAPAPGAAPTAPVAAPLAAPLAAAPLEGDRTPAAPRPVAELIGRYQIGSLKQAGAVRARRQISFDEYMALKRHFAAAEGAVASGQ
jgi:hypothetical protein